MKAICIAEFLHFKENHLYEYNSYPETMTIGSIGKPDEEIIIDIIYSVRGMRIGSMEFNQHFRKFL